MHIPAEPAERSRPGMSTGRITAAALQIVDTEGPVGQFAGGSWVSQAVVSPR